MVNEVGHKASTNGHVSFVVRHQVKSGCQDKYESWLGRITTTAAGYEGHLGVQIARPAEGGNDYVTVVRFASSKDAVHWARSRDRQDLIKAVTELLEGKEEVEIRSGIDFWFTPESSRYQHPVRWKQWLITTSVIWPLTMAVPLACKPLFDLYPPLGLWGVSHGIIASIIVALVVYIVMPRYVRAVSHWLFRN